MKLDIGGGNIRVADLQGVNPDDYVVVDPFRTGHANQIVAPAWEIPLPADSVEEIYSSHMLEHISHHQTVSTLREWHRILQPCGVLRLFIPDLEWCVQRWLEQPDEPGSEKDGWNLHTIFGAQAYEGDTHRTGFTAASIRRRLIEAGFVPSWIDVSKRMCPTVHYQAEIVVEARK